MTVRRLLAAVAAVVLLAGIAHADEQGFTNRATELKEKASADSATVAPLPADTPVKVLAREGGWTQVEAGGKSGWVRMFHLRFAGGVQSGGSSGSLASLGNALGIGSKQDQQAHIASTGIRGLSTEDLKNANPDPEAVKRMQSYRADKPAAERFAKEGKLAEARVPAPGEGR